MNPAYAARVESCKFFAPPGVLPLATISPIPRSISCDEVHVKKFFKSGADRELEDFLKELLDEHGEYQVIETLELDKFMLLFYAVPRRMVRAPCRFIVCE